MLTEWIKSVLICSVLFSICLYIAPDPQMKRYVRNAVGFVMIIVVLSPLINLLGAQERLTFDMLKATLTAEIDDGDNAVYVAAMESIVETFVSKQYGVKVQVYITLSENLTIAGMSVAIDYRYMSENGESAGDGMAGVMRSGLAEEYGIDESLIIIM